jgi:ATP phosphoribosyltransferase regulatory subunit
MRKWLLPEYIDDVLPPEAERIERLRRTLLDHFRARGYRLVQPPMLEHLDSLLTGTGHDLDLQMFKVVDQLSGRLLGLRADTTPQVARIDAHLLNEPGITRLCYCGSVLRTLPADLMQTREVLQIGAELYGHDGVESDREVLRMLLSALATARVAPLHLDLGHVGVYRALVRAAGIDAGADDELFTALRGKDVALLETLTGNLSEPWRGALRALPALYGEAEAVLVAARVKLPALPEVHAALATVGALAAAARGAVATLNVDLADLRGYDYETGALFAVFTPGAPNAIGKGGRYDGIGKAFGRARPATGFTLDLRRLAELAPDGKDTRAVLAPNRDDSALDAAIAKLRAAGEVVVLDLPGADASAQADRELVLTDGTWQVALRRR